MWHAMSLKTCFYPKGQVIVNQKTYTHMYLKTHAKNSEPSETCQRQHVKKIDPNKCKISKSTFNNFGY